MAMFSKDFVWGCATSAFQIEGALNEGGRGKSIWDVFCDTPGKIWGDCKPEPACDFYHRYKEDIRIMKDLGIQAYRFSLSWPRILPEGIGRVNEEGIRFYNDVIDELLKAGIEPYITMYHWDFPEALQEKGGWLNEESVDWFAEYACVVSDRFSDRVKKFITFNEPQCFSGISFLHKDHAPGIALELKDQFLFVHHVLMAHGKAVIALRKNAHQPIEVGFAPTCGMPYPKTKRCEDIEAARQVLFTCPDDLSNWTWNVPWFSDPVFLGHYPEDGLKKYKEYLPDIKKEDMELIAQPLDFMGENIYNGYAIEMGEDGTPVYCDRKPGYDLTGNVWPVTPKCFEWGLKYLYERYKMPIVVTENGTCCKDVISPDGRVHDQNRIDFLSRYILAMKKAMDAGVDIRGYFEWTLTDNFEWNLGYRDRFGLVYVDFETQRRTLKDSAFFYRNVIRTRGDAILLDRPLLFFRPEYKEMIWGGNRMKEVFGYDIPGDSTGEAWAISAHPNGNCTCVTEPFAGETLADLWENHHELFGFFAGERFPLLLKVIDAKADLSIQVHPDDNYARKHENGSLGKTECWYILDCDENATLVVGHNAKTKEELCKLIDNQEFSKLIREIPIKKGDFIQIDPGTVHAIKGGTLLLETQQNSDITYRVYDYDRLMNGKKRELHLEKSKDVITVPCTGDAIIHTSDVPGEELLAACQYYTVSKLNVVSSFSFAKTEKFRIVSVVDGCGYANGVSIQKGDHFIVPSNYKELKLEGEMTVITSTP